MSVGAFDFDALPGDLQRVLKTVGIGLSGRRLTPELVEQCQADWQKVVPDTAVTITHGDRGTVHAHHYLVRFSRPRWNATWRFRSGEFENLCKRAVS